MLSHLKTALVCYVRLELGKQKYTIFFAKSGLSNTDWTEVTREGGRVGPRQIQAENDKGCIGVSNLILTA